MPQAKHIVDGAIPAMGFGAGSVLWEMPHSSPVPTAPAGTAKSQQKTRG